MWVSCEEQNVDPEADMTQEFQSKSLNLQRYKVTRESRRQMTFWGKFDIPTYHWLIQASLYTVPVRQYKGQKHYRATATA